MFSAGMVKSPAWTTPLSIRPSRCWLARTPSPEGRFSTAWWLDAGKARAMLSRAARTPGDENRAPVAWGPARPGPGRGRARVAGCDPGVERGAVKLTLDLHDIYNRGTQI